MSQNKWIQIRKDLTQALEQQVKSLLGENSPDLAAYNSEYQKEFKKKWKISSKKEILQSFSVSQLVLLGDFHALQQSQKSHLRLLREFVQKRKSLVLALECFSVDDQHKLDKYMTGRWNEKDFLKSIQWQKQWGFPWENIRPLMRWLQKHKVPVYGLNIKDNSSSKKTLRERDHFAALKIKDILEIHPDHLPIIIYGDLHLARPHLPKQLLKVLGPSVMKKTLRVFQNSEKIYFELLKTEKESTTDVVHLGKHDFCLLNVPPWVKWQNYLMYLEKTYDRGLKSKEDDIDYTDHVGRFVKLLAEDLGCQVKLTELSVYNTKDKNFWSQLQKKLSNKDLKVIEFFIETQRSFYLPSVQIAYLARASVNHAAHLAMLFLRQQLTQEKHNYLNMPQDFLRQIWLETISYLGSKMINPKRKTDTLFDIKLAMTSGPGAQIESEALKLALSQKMRELILLSGRQYSRAAYVPKKRKSYFIAAELLGGMLGEKIYNGFHRKMINMDLIRTLVLKSVAYDGFELAYYEILEIIEALPEPFKSKQERL
ncbi:MAG: ChaN family lipoprotein [Pseudobdellovibrionaceae bacterium]